jgi:hypothetical protein
VTLSSSPRPRRTSCGGFARRRLAPNAASPSSMKAKPWKPGGTGVVTSPPVGNSISRTSAGVPRRTGEPSPTKTRTVASPSCRRGTCSGCSTCALGSACLSFRARFTQNKTLRNSVSAWPSSNSSAPIASACQTPRPVLSARSAPSDSCALSMAPPGPVLWPVLTDPSRTYQRLSNPRWGCLVSTFARSDSRRRPSWTRMNGSTCSYGTPREGKASRMGCPMTWIHAASSTRTASRPVVSIWLFMLPLLSGSAGPFCYAPGRGLRLASGGHQLERRPSSSQPAVAAPASYALWRNSSSVPRGSGELRTSS